MAFICLENCKCKDCKHNRYDIERDDKSCFLGVDLKAQGEAAYNDYVFRSYLAVIKNKK